MIDEQVIRQRIGQLQAERAEVEQGLQRMAAEMERGRQLLYSYDGAIGELSALIQPVADDEARQE